MVRMASIKWLSSPMTRMISVGLLRSSPAGSVYPEKGSMVFFGNRTRAVVRWWLPEELVKKIGGFEMIVVF
jgi:hypothetical protein